MTEHNNDNALALVAEMREQIAALTLRVNALDAVREELNALKLHVSALEQRAAKAAAAPATMPPPVLTSVAPRTTAKRPRTSWL